MNLKSILGMFCVLALCGCAATAAPIEVGTGQNSSGVYIEFNDGFIAEFIVKFDALAISGLDIFDTIEAETTLTTVRDNFGWGIFIDGISYQGHSNIGYQGGENWWHYWIDDGQGWSSSGYGVADRTVYDGYSDGWIYGRAGEPLPEPATLFFLCGGFMLLRRRID
jgi:hypothetical protein